MSHSIYNPREYWLSKGKIYKEQFKYDEKKRLQEEVLADYLKTIPPFTSVLEFGCGFGRISNVVLSKFRDIKEYIAMDLSPDQLKNATRYVKSDKIRFIESDIQSLKLDRKFDLVFGVSVLLHVLPTEIAQVVGKLVSLSKKHVMNVDYYEQKGGKVQLASHNFLHDYESIYKSLPRVISVKRVPVAKKMAFSVLDAKQSLFHATVAAANE